MKIWAVVVTYNRKALLLRCINALASQSLPPQRILVVDNASTDGTLEALREQGWLARNDFEFLHLSDNTGGAGGFEAGMRHAVAQGAEWLWLMDDDAIPCPEALACLVAAKPDPSNLYGSAAVTGDSLSWPMRPYRTSGRLEWRLLSEIPRSIDVQFIPFLGLLVSASLTSRIGFPDGEFFIAADDVDYCLRARRSGASIILVPSSRLEHPLSERYWIPLPWRKFYNLRLSPLKRYYDTRNRILVARNHYGLALYFKTIPGSFLRLVATLVHERDRKRQLMAFGAGMVDGLLGRKGRRHEHWGL